MFNIGDYVSRISYNHDVVFEIIDIKGDIAILKGSYVRLLADAPLSDLVVSDDRDEYEPDNLYDLLDRDEFFYLPGKVLHIDGDESYLNKSMEYYKKNGVKAYGMCLKESDIENKIIDLLDETKPDILIITGHDAIVEKNGDINNIDIYKNSKYFINSVRKAREYEKSHEKLVVIAGACQSDYEELIKSGANFASSPKRVNIHALDPAVIAVTVALTDKNDRLNIKDLLNKTKYGSSGMGGLLGNGMMYVGYPR